MKHKNGTFLADEEMAYPNGGQTRKGAALFPDGIVRRVWAGIPDTYFSIPAHARIKGKYVAGFLSIDTSLVGVEGAGTMLVAESKDFGILRFTPYTEKKKASND